MRRGNREDVVKRPVRAKAAARKKPPTLAELRARVIWLEGCQRANVETLGALGAQAKVLTDRLAGVEWRQHRRKTVEETAAGPKGYDAYAAFAQTRAQCAAAALSAIQSGVVITSHAKRGSAFLAGVRQAFRDASAVLIGLAVVALVGLLVVAIWWPWH